MSAMETDRHLSVSVLIATYNRDTSLCETMESVFSQDYQGKTELIVVDQSKDHSEEVRRFFRVHRDDFHYIFQSKPNLPGARNTAFSVAKGELVLFVDDDVILPRNGVGRLALHFQPFRLQALSGLVLSEQNPEASLNEYARTCGARVKEVLPHLVRVPRFIGATMFLPAEAVRLVHGFDEEMGRLTATACGEDDDFCCRLRKAGVPLFLDTSLRVIHRDHLPGGCQSRRIDRELARTYQMKSIAYISAKYHGRVGLRGWIRLTRGYVLNRQALSKGLPHMRSCFLQACRAIREAERFIAANRKRPSPPAVPQ